MTDPLGPLTQKAIAPLEPSAGAQPPQGARDEELRRNAQAFEAAFVAQMLTHSGLGDALSSNSGFGGEAFSSLLIEQYAEKLVEQGGFGLAEKIYEQLRDRNMAHDPRTES